MNDAESAITALIALMARLRDPQRGCPWDQKQTFATVAPYTIEEAYEVADAIEKGDPTQLRDELGDLLFQVVFHAQMAQERGWFEFAQVAGGLAVLVGAAKLGKRGGRVGFDWLDAAQVREKVLEELGEVDGALAAAAGGTSGAGAGSADAGATGVAGAASGGSAGAGA